MKIPDGGCETLRAAAEAPLLLGPNLHYLVAE